LALRTKSQPRSAGDFDMDPDFLIDTMRISAGISGKAGEIQETFKKYVRGDFGKEELRKRIKVEVGDVLWYLAVLLDAFDLPMADVAEANIKKLSSRQERGVIRGDGDTR
jgi:NTP pyrophosphatase (non-canonical NTP hydrolase)